MLKQNLFAAVLFALVAGQVQAVPTAFDFDVTGAGGDVTWQGIDDEFAASDFNLNLPTSGSRAIAINDASTPNDSDAYDDAFAVSVNGMLVDDDDGVVDLTSTAAGTNMVADPVLPAAFAGAYEFFFFNSDPIVRLLFSVSNISASTSNALIEIATDLGSDGDETVEDEGSGNGTFGTEDDFVLFSDDDGDDPNLLFTFFGAGASELPTISDLLDDDVNTLFDLNLEPGETKSLLLFGGVFDTVLFSLGDASTLGETLTGSLSQLSAAGYLTGLSTNQINSIVNYGQVPEPGTVALFALGLAGLGLRRKKA